MHRTIIDPMSVRVRASRRIGQDWAVSAHQLHAANELPQFRSLWGDYQSGSVVIVPYFGISERRLVDLPDSPHPYSKGIFAKPIWLGN
jgi:hypothetical protein